MSSLHEVVTVFTEGSVAAAITVGAAGVVLTGAILSGASLMHERLGRRRGSVRRFATTKNPSPFHYRSRPRS